MKHTRMKLKTAVKNLHEGWKFRQARLTNWYPATVPGVVHTDLLQNKIIEDPFFRLNERGLQWIDKEDWVYETCFTLAADMMRKENMELVFEGLDTYADVYLNDECILKANNMFRRWSIPVRQYIREENNILKVYFHSPVKIDVPKWDALPYQYPASNDQSENGGLFNKKISIFARKAGYHYGWDWGPRLVTSGIWRPVYIRAWSDLRINDVFIEQKEVGAGRAVIAGHVELDADKDMDGVLVTITDEATGRVLGEWQADLKRGTNRVTVDFVLHKPKLWWSNGLGEPFLYRFRTDIIAGGELLDSKTERVGIRSLKVVHQPDKDGHTFYIELNGRPVFAKGANYIPLDNFLPRVTPENYKRTILDAAGVNMNMLRVWGGGIYENDVFYDLCDEHGIMIWQDFMFACSMYPAEGALLDNIHQEAVDNVKRLRNHACIALWCGNNECQDAWLGWGWKREIERQNKEYADKIWAQYRQQYHVTLPGVVREYAPGTFYWPSSPFAFEGEMSGTTDGDRHYWSVWHGKAPISDYDSEKSRFFSEYGFQSFPEFESVKRYAPYPEDWDIRSEVMMSHQRGGDHANGLIETYLLNEYKKPRDFRAFLYMNHVLQGDAIKTAIESHRRQMPYNMGTLFWQHNDCWPVASWASRDYYGRWKAQHYYVRKAYDDILISPVVEGDDLKVYAVSDRLENTSGRLQLQVCQFDGTVVHHWGKSVGISGNDSRVCFSAPLAKLLEGANRGTVYVRVDYTDKSGRVYHNNYCLGKQKDMDYPKVDLQTEVRSIEGGYEVTVSADKFARAVCLSVADNESVYSDNYFDVQPKSSVQVQVRTRLSAEAFNGSLRLTCLNNEF
ncbi:glycoside hydrolase family 2 protein [Bacteroides sp. AM07-18]|uniref:Beta-mannosidase B n=3 Tax=Bacteroides uniformis TaxID=820 RepID=A0A374N0D3_BACUN|nr:MULTISPECIES: glycoside hydrolase family 2 protein [Bacteroides]RJU26361.1 glycoside hydrolase family 2 protein [Bacteroides sp. AM51-7]MBV4215923.1 glycoside hydrolase family 2 protein [Bacteroides uniformis]MBV4229980.1 glycoside hydrolase family 2 protein [Bacteroides uniformis]MCB6978591.1 glycoside hydrolase family 2 protein [Bacteroides uniformis]MCB7025970.1 glycoside hydrolase family 2 protein [Bacteroides uniformis]